MESRVHDGQGPVILGRYELLKRIAVGGMAEIYLARASGIGFEKLCVVKLILPQLVNEPHLVQMFLDEARVAATLQHQNVVQMYDVGEVNGEYFISMEFLEGEDCRAIYKMMRRKRMHVPFEVALAITIGAARGLHFAHEKVGFDGKPLHIVHRDVTPHNVFITYDGGIKLLDFGVAKASNRRNKTTAGTLKGKIPYMSPEQCRGLELDRRSDIYALGILLYELTTGVRLYSTARDGEFETMRKIVEDPVTPPSMHREDYPAVLESIALKCLDKDPKKRFQTALDVQSELEDYVRSNQLAVSSITTSQFMREHFHEHINVWQKAAGDETKLVEAIAEKLKETKSPRAETSSKRGSEHSVASKSASSRTPSAVGEVISKAEIDEASGSDPGFSEDAKTILDDSRLRAVRANTRSENTPPPVDTAMVAPLPAPLTPESRWPIAVIGLVLAIIFGIAIGTTGDDDGKTKAASGRWADDTAEQRRSQKTGPPNVRGARDGHGQAAVEVGAIRVTSSPACELFVDGEKRGTTPQLVEELSAGEHEIRLRNAEHGIDETRQIVVRANELVEENYQFSGQ